LYGSWHARLEEAGSPGFRRIVLLTLATQMLLIPTWIGHNQILLLPVALVVAVHARRFWSAGALGKFLLTTSAAALLWERIAAALLAVASAAGWRSGPPVMVALPVYPLFLFPVLAILLAAAYRRLNGAVQAATK
jgi:hypothetical protein